MPLQIGLLEQSFAAVAPKGDELVEVFYKNLFADFPQVRPLFADVRMAEQKKKLLASLQLVVGNLRRPSVLGPALNELGSRHVDYGAQEGHYPAVGQTLLKSLAQVAGDAWNDELDRAWAEAYGVVAQAMIEGAAVPA